jgi:putative flavoprotein involved in K+ transport
MQSEFVETLIIGGGQSGLVMSHMLSGKGQKHLIVERDRIAERWRTERWTGLRFQFPNWSIRLPGFEFTSSDPDGFATSEDIVNYITAYARFAQAPIRCGVGVETLRSRASDGRFIAETAAGYIEADNVVVCTGPYQRPAIPDFTPDDTVFQVHANAYRDPSQLPPGAVLIVGAGASGSQIAEELVRAGRRVFLSVGRHRRLPRRYRGHDLTWWLTEMGIDRTPAEKRGPDRTLPLITGAYGGHTIDLREFAQQGITLVGRVRDIRGRKAAIADDLAESLSQGDRSYLGFLDRVDAYIADRGLSLPEEPSAREMLPEPDCVREPVRDLDLEKAGITSILWATGYTPDYGWIECPVLDTAGEPIHRHGVTDTPGLYFLGLPWLSRMNSSFLSGVGEDAAYLADHISARVGCGPEPNKA